MARKTGWGVRPKNDQQAEAMKHLLDASIDLVVLEGIAGSGKTYLALAAALEQVIEQHTYSEIIFTRAPIAVGDDLGFLPGTIDEKMLPWCGALLDNMEALKLDPKDAERYIKLLAMQHMRGRSFSRRYIIIDEVQNITVQQLKVLLTRAGEDTKIVCLGDTEQIDNRKINKGADALSFLCKVASSVDFIKVVELPDGVRSRLATWSAQNL